METREHQLERRWRHLLDSIRAGIVVPVVGRELLWTEIDGRLQFVPAYLASQLATDAGLPVPGDGENDPVNSIVHAYLSQQEITRHWPYTKIAALTNELRKAPPPRALLKLAELPFRLFVSTTSDDFLERAVNAVRFGGRPETHVPPYCLGSSVDLPIDRLGAHTVVFPLLGAAHPAPDYALTDEDVLEFVHQFQATDSPKRLLSVLRQRHLLLIGDGFSDWLARFFVRLSKPDRLWASRATQFTSFVADAEATNNSRLRQFLQHPFTDTWVFPTRMATEFVDELHRRWTERYPVAAGSETWQPAERSDRLQFGGVFISYCREDYHEAKRICDALEDARIDVWFDERALEPGEEFERRIARQIADSAFFLAVISRHWFRPGRRFIRFEWREAELQEKRAPFDVPFIIPVSIDDTSPTDTGLPDRLRHLHWTKAPAGAPDPKFIDDLVRKYRAARKAASAL